jgi:hypothetical protein
MLAHDLARGIACFILLPRLPPHTTQWNGWELVRSTRGARTKQLTSATRSTLEGMSIAGLKNELKKQDLHCLGRGKPALVQRLLEAQREWTVEQLAGVYTAAMKSQTTDPREVAHFAALARKLNEGLRESNWCPHASGDPTQWAVCALKAMIVCSKRGPSASAADAHVGRTIIFCSLWRGMLHTLSQLQACDARVALTIRSVARRDVAAYVVTKALRWWKVQMEKVECVFIFRPLAAPNNSMHVLADTPPPPSPPPPPHFLPTDITAKLRSSNSTRKQRR